MKNGGRRVEVALVTTRALVSDNQHEVMRQAVTLNGNRASRAAAGRGCRPSAGVGLQRRAHNRKKEAPTVELPGPLVIRILSLDFEK
jgi:hypothetical protein